MGLLLLLTFLLLLMLSLSHHEKCRNLLDRKRRRELDEEYKRASDAVYAAEQQIQQRKSQDTQAARAMAADKRAAVHNHVSRLQKRLRHVNEQQAAVKHLVKLFPSEGPLVSLAIKELPNLEAVRVENETMMHHTQGDIRKIEDDLKVQEKVIAEKAIEAAQELFGPVPDTAPSNFTIEEVDRPIDPVRPDVPSRVRTISVLLIHFVIRTYQNSICCRRCKQAEETIADRVAMRHDETFSPMAVRTSTQCLCGNCASLKCSNGRCKSCCLKYQQAVFQACSMSGCSKSSHCLAR